MIIFIRSFVRVLWACGGQKYRMLKKKSWFCPLCIHLINRRMFHIPSTMYIEPECCRSAEMHTIWIAEHKMLQSIRSTPTAMHIITVRANTVGTHKSHAFPLLSTTLQTFTFFQKRVGATCLFVHCTGTGE
jgi:hypothetical protein